MPAEVANKTGETRVERKRARTREQILDAAEEIFTQRRSARMEDLAEKADVSVGAIYTHFGNKDGVVAALAERALLELDSHFDRAFDASRSPLEQVMSVADVYLRFCLEHRPAFRLLVLERSGLVESDTSIGKRGLTEGIDKLLHRFETAIAAAVAAGEIDSRYSPAHTARFLWGAWNGVVTLSLRDDTLTLDKEELIAALETGRRLVNEGLTSPSFRTREGYSRGQLVDADQLLNP